LLIKLDGFSSSFDPLLLHVVVLLLLHVVVLLLWWLLLFFFLLLLLLLWWWWWWWWWWCSCCSSSVFVSTCSIYLLIKLNGLSSSFDCSDMIKVGDVVLSVDGEKMSSRRSLLAPLFAGSTPHAKKWRLHHGLLAGKKGSRARCIAFDSIVCFDFQLCC